VIEIKIPTLGESVNEGVIARWLKAEGDFVKADESLIELETDKAVMEIPSETSGRLHILVQEGKTVGVGQTIAQVDESVQGLETSTEAPSQAPALENSTAKAKPKDALKLSPAVRKLVTEHNLEPLQIQGSGKGGRLTKADVLDHLKTQERASAQSAPAPAPVPTPDVDDEVRREPLSKIRQRIAQRLLEAQHNAAILTTFNDVDMSAVMALRKRYKEPFEKKYGVRLGFMSLFGRAVVQALQAVPQLNAQLDGTDVLFHKHVHLGFAVSTQRGLMVPVVHYADQMTIAELERAVGQLAARGRAGKITPDELAGGTFSITNGGVFGSLLSTPILNPPQSGILGMHRIEERPVAVDGQVVIRPMMYVALSYDHRLVDGKEAVTFLVRVKQYLEDPERMLFDV